MLKWDETDFIECLEVLPTAEEYGTEYIFRVEQEKITLSLCVRPYESIIDLALLLPQESEPLTQFSLSVAGKIKLVKGKYREWLELADCTVVAGRFYYAENNVNVWGKSSWYRSQVQIAIKPHIQIKFL